MSSKFLKSAAAVASAAVMLGAGPAFATIVDLSGFPQTDGGRIVNGLGEVAAGLTINGSGDTGNVILITTEDVPADGDLESPFQRIIDNTPTFVDEMVGSPTLLTVAEGGCGVDFCDENDTAQDHSIEFIFDRDVVFNEVSVFDVAGAGIFTVSLFDDMDMLVGSVIANTLNSDLGSDDSGPFRAYERISLLGQIARRAVFEFDGDSGGIGLFDIQEVPVPAALPLLITGIAGLGFASRRKKRTA